MLLNERKDLERVDIETRATTPRVLITEDKAKCEVSERDAVGASRATTHCASNAEGKAEPVPKEQSPPAELRGTVSVDTDRFSTPRRVVTLSRKRLHTRSVVLGRQGTFYSVLSVEDEGGDDVLSPRITDNDASDVATLETTNQSGRDATNASHVGFGEIPVWWQQGCANCDIYETQDRSMQDLEEIALGQMDKRQRKKYRRHQRASVMRVSEIGSDTASSLEKLPPMDPRSIRSLRFNVVTLGRQEVSDAGHLEDSDSPSPNRPAKHSGIGHFTPVETGGAEMSRHAEIYRESPEIRQRVNRDARVAARLHQAVNQPDDVDDSDQLTDVEVTMGGYAKIMRISRGEIRRFRAGSVPADAKQAPTAPRILEPPVTAPEGALDADRNRKRKEKSKKQRKHKHGKDSSSGSSSSSDSSSSESEI